MQPTLTIDASALSHNLACIKAKCPNAKVLAYVKQDAYGLGIEPIAAALAEAEGFGITDMHAGITLRSMFTDKVIVHAAIAPDVAMLKAAIHQDITVVVYSEEVLALVEKHQLKGRYWLKINTGFNRLGMPIKDVDMALTRLAKWSTQSIVLMTHFMDANPDLPSFQQQYQRWLTLTETKDLAISHASSNWLLNNLAPIGDWVRPGLMLYGQMQVAEWSLQPVLKLTAPVFQIQSVQKGEYIGYDHTHQFAQDTRVAIVGFGYGDGLPPFVKSVFMVNGQTFDVVGRISMDFVALDIGDSPLQAGEFVEINLYEMYDAPKQAALVAMNRRRLKTQVKYVTT